MIETTEKAAGQLDLDLESREQMLARNYALDLEIMALTDKLTRHQADGAKIKADIKAKLAEKDDLIMKLEGNQVTFNVVVTEQADEPAGDDSDYPSEEELAAMDEPAWDEQDFQARLAEAMALPWTVEIEFDKADDVYYARIRELKCFSEGMTEEKARESIQEALTAHLTSMLLDGVPIPQPAAVGERPDDAEEGECLGGFTVAEDAVPLDDAPAAEAPDTSMADSAVDASQPGDEEA